MNANSDAIKYLASALVTLATAGIGALGAWLARWKIQELSRERLVGLVSEQKAFLDEKDRMLASLRDELARIEQRCGDQGKRMQELDEQLLEMTRREYLRERWVRRMLVVCEAAGLAVPPREGDR